MVKVTRIFDRILNYFAFLAAAIIAFIMLSVGSEVVLRNFFGNPLTWITDISGILLVYMTFLAAAWLFREDGHVKMDWLQHMLSPRNQVYLRLATLIICSMMFLVITIYGVQVTWNLFSLGYYMSTGLETPRFLITGIVPVGGFFLLCQAVRQTIKVIRNEFITKPLPISGTEGLPSNPP